MIKNLIIGFLNQNIINNLPISLESISIMSYYENELKKFNKLPMNCVIKTIRENENFF